MQGKRDNNLHLTLESLNGQKGSGHSVEEFRKGLLEDVASFDVLGLQEGEGLEFGVFLLHLEDGFSTEVDVLLPADEVSKLKEEWRR